MRSITLVGIGAGHPDHLTLQAVEAIGKAEVFFIIEKGTAADQLVALREAILARFARKPGWRLVRIADPRRAAAGDYGAAVADWHSARTRLFAEAIGRELPDGSHGAVLVWGDPALYDSAIRILGAVAADGLAFRLDVIPGISAPQALAAAHRIPLNRIGEPVHVTTGRRIAQGLPPEVDSTVVMLDDGTGLASIDPRGLDIWWGAYLGTPDEVLMAGPLAEIREAILALRAERRAAIGWIMDTYLLRRAQA
jgi:precorrin-6A synthase